MLEDFMKKTGIDAPKHKNMQYNPVFEKYLPTILKYAACPYSETIAKHISGKSKIYTKDDVGSYNIPQLRNLFEFCIDHRNRFSRPLTDDTIALVHPAYMFYRCPEMIEDSEEEAEEYLERLADVLINKKGDISIIILDTIQHYATFSSLLLEHDLVDDVLFTRYNAGFVHEEEDISLLKGKRLFVAGGNNHECLTNICEQVTYKYGDEKLYVIPQLVVQDTRYGRFLQPEHVHAGTFLEFPIEKRVIMHDLTCKEQVSA